MVKTLGYLMLVLVVVSLAACQGDASPQPTTDDSPTAASRPVERAAPTQETAAPPAAAAPTVAPLPPDASAGDWDDRELFRAGLVSAAQSVLEELPGASVYRIELTIPPDFRVLDGRQQVWYTNRESGPLNEIYFQLFPNVAGGRTTIETLQVDGQDVTPVYEFGDSALRVTLPDVLLPGESAVVQMDYAVEVAQEMAGNYGLFGYFDGVLVLDGFYPVIPVYDSVGTRVEPAGGWNVKDPAPNGDVTYFDASFYRVQVTAPAALTLVASGIEVERANAGKTQFVTFAAGPARDFYLAACDDYVVFSATVGETTVNSYALPEQEEHARLALHVAVDALESFGQRFGLYPYTEFDVAGTPMRALGIEYPGMTGIALGLYDPQARVSGLPTAVMLESTVAHEVGHQWFYNVVGNDQVDAPWLDEAVVQYLTGLYFRDVYGEDAEQSYRESWHGRWERVDRAEIPIGLPAGEYDRREYGAIVYGRGPLFVAALEEEMGRETFDRFLRDYYQTHLWGIGKEEAFRELAEQHCRCDLTALFEAWVY
ncbi:MAG TPA: M1 family peptidase [Chloroflexi bacterium]|nr:M1 family peptidase [Chloroflexota bacterium]